MNSKILNELSTFTQLMSSFSPTLLNLYSWLSCAHNFVSPICISVLCWKKLYYVVFWLPYHCTVKTKQNKINEWIKFTSDILIQLNPHNNSILSSLHIYNWFLGISARKLQGNKCGVVCFWHNGKTDWHQERNSDFLGFYQTVFIKCQVNAF